MGVIHSGSIEETKDSDIIIITAGVGQKKGETRLDLINKNYKVFKSFVPTLAKLSPNSILLVVANPVDVLSLITYKLSGFPKERVIGSGTVLDTSRLKYIIGKYFGIAQNNIHASVLAEHGDSEFVAWDEATIGHMPIDKYAKMNGIEWDDELKAIIERDVRTSAYEIINRKGATYFAVASAIVRIVEAIIRDENSILTVSSYLQGEYGINDVFISVPTIVNRKGVEKILDIDLSTDERGQLKKSAHILKENCKKIN